MVCGYRGGVEVGKALRTSGRRTETKVTVGGTSRKTFPVLRTSREKAGRKGAGQGG